MADNQKTTVPKMCFDCGLVPHIDGSDFCKWCYERQSAQWCPVPLDQTTKRKPLPPPEPAYGYHYVDDLGNWELDAPQPSVWRRVWSLFCRSESNAE